MKKLFILFMLVVLVSFTVGCGLFGGDDDSGAIPVVTILKASVQGFKALGSMRTAVLDDVKAKDLTLALNGIILTPFAAIDNNDGTYNIDFSALINEQTMGSYKQIMAGQKEMFLTITTTDADGKSTYVSAAIVSPKIKPDNQLNIPVAIVGKTILIDANKIAVVNSGTYTKVADVVAVAFGQDSKDAKALTYKVTNNDVELATNTKSVTEVAEPLFKVAIKEEGKMLNVADVKFDISVKDTKGSEVALTSKNFSVDPKKGKQSVITLTVNAEDKTKLKSGQTYEVKINAVADGKNRLEAKTFYFKFK